MRCPDPGLRARSALRPWGGLALGVAPLVAVLGVLALRRPFVIIDTTLVVRGADAAVGCLRAGRLMGCPDVGFYPLLQYPVAAIARVGGLTLAGTFSLLAMLNVLAFGAMIVMTGVVARRAGSPNLGRAGFAVLASGTLPVFAVSTFGEGLAAGLVFAASSSILLGWPRSLQMLLFAAVSMSKESAPPMLALLSVPCLLVARARFGVRARPTIVMLAAGIGVGILCNSLFNIFRYRTPINAFYVLPEHFVPTAALWADFTAASLFAPNAGLLFFWPLSLVAISGCLTAIGREPRWRSIAAVSTIGVLLALAAAFARWFSPFGWNSWGPRFLVPWVPGLCLLSLLIAQDDLDRLWARIGAAFGVGLAGLLAAAAVTAASLPGLSYIADKTAFARFFTYWGDLACPGGFDLKSNFYPCVEHHAWAHRPVLVLDSLPGIVSPLGIGLAACVALASLAVFAPGMRRRGRRSATTTPADAP